VSHAIQDVGQKLEHTITDGNISRNLYHSFTHLSDWEAGGDVSKAWDKVVHPGRPATEKPSTPAPTMADASQTALGGELQREKNMRSTWSMLTGGQGLVDDNPRVAGPQLLGS
jgi:hypothetical protein